MKKILLVLCFSICTLAAFEDLTPEDTKEDPSSVKETPKIEENVDLDSLQKAYLNDDNNDAIIVYKYDPKVLMKIRTRVLSKTTVILPKGEVPIGKNNGSTRGFNVELTKDKNPKFNLKNTFTITPAYVGIDTSLTIFGSSGRIYNFYLYSTDSTNKKIPNSTVYVTKDGNMPISSYVVNFDEKDKEILKLKKDIKKYEEKLNIAKQKKSKNLKKFNIADIQLDYKFDKDFKLEAVFNDDEYTYFKFDKKFNIPKFYRIDALNDKINMNFTIFENIIKVHKLSKVWHLDLNGSYLTIKKTGSFKMDYSHKKIFVDMTLTKFPFESISGDENLKPEIVFHDKEFTYFKFDISDGFKKFPSIYRVVDGYDNPVNFEIVDDYIVVKILHDSFTLRLGEKHNCIRLIK